MNADEYNEYVNGNIGAILGEQEDGNPVPAGNAYTVPDINLCTDTKEILAWETLKEPNPMKFFEEVFGTIHCGDEESLRAVIYAACLQSSVTSRGLHPTVTGTKGSGKSSGITAALHLLPRHNVKEGSMSPKAFLFMKVSAKTIFYLDDLEYNPEFNSLAKRAMTNFQRTTTHSTVAHTGGKGGGQFGSVTVSLAPRCVFITTSVHPMGDDQLLDRQIGFSGTCTDENYTSWEQARRLSGREELPVTFDVERCRDVMQIISERDFVVTHHRKIKFAFENDRRLINQLYDLIEASAILNFMNRGYSVDTRGIFHITTSDEDLINALDFTMFQTASGSTEGRLTPAERKLDMILVQSMPSSLTNMPFTETDIARIYGKSIQAVRKLLYGNKGNFRDVHGGLLEKTKWYLPDVDQNTHQNVIRIEKHSVNYGCVFAEWD